MARKQPRTAGKEAKKSPRCDAWAVVNALVWEVFPFSANITVPQRHRAIGVFRKPPAPQYEFAPRFEINER